MGQDPYIFQNPWPNPQCICLYSNPLDTCAAVKFLAANKICTDDAEAAALMGLLADSDRPTSPTDQARGDSYALTGPRRTGNSRFRKGCSTGSQSMTASEPGTVRWCNHFGETSDGSGRLSNGANYSFLSANCLTDPTPSPIPWRPMNEVRHDGVYTLHCLFFWPQMNELRPRA